MDHFCPCIDNEVEYKEVTFHCISLTMLNVKREQIKKIHMTKIGFKQVFDFDFQCSTSNLLLKFFRFLLSL